MRRLSIFQRTLLIAVIAGVSLIALVAVGTLSRFQVMEAQRVDELRRLVETAVSIAEHHLARAEAGEITREEANAAWFDQVRAMRYDGDNYLFAFEGTITRVHPVRRDLEGTDLDQLRTPDGVLFMREFSRVVNEGGRGVYRYVWPRPGSDEPV